MHGFDEIFAIAAKRKGGAAELEKLLAKPLSAKKLATIPDDRWLSCMTKCIFQSGFNWKVVDNMWPGFEAPLRGSTSAAAPCWTTTILQGLPATAAWCATAPRSPPCGRMQSS